MKCMDGDLPDGEHFFQRAAGCWNGGRSARWISPRSCFFERAAASVEKDGFFPLQEALVPGLDPSGRRRREAVAVRQAEWYREKVSSLQHRTCAADFFLRCREFFCDFSDSFHGALLPCDSYQSRHKYILQKEGKEK